MVSALTRWVTMLLVIAAAQLAAAAETAPAPVPTSVAVTGYYYSMRDEPDFGVGVATVDHGPWHFETRYNYEAHNAASAFVGWTFSGGDAVTFEVTPIVGALFAAGRGFIPGVEASVAWGPLDAYIEAEYVDDRNQPGTRYTYAWAEIGWRPAEWLRLGLASQHTNTVDTGRDIQRGIFAQFTVKRVTLSVYAFNPDSGSRYIITSLGASF